MLGLPRSSSGRVMCRPGPRLAPESAPPSASLFACHAAVRRRRLEVPLGRIPDLHTGWHDCDTWRVHRAGRVQSVECSRRRTLTQGSIGFSRSSTMRPEGWLDNPTLSSDTNPTPPRHPDTTRHHPTPPDSPTARQLRQPNVCEDVCTLARLTRQTRHTPTAPTARQPRTATHGVSL